MKPKEKQLQIRKINHVIQIFLNHPHIENEQPQAGFFLGLNNSITIHCGYFFLIFYLMIPMIFSGSCIFDIEISVFKGDIFL